MREEDRDRPPLDEDRLQLDGSTPDLPGGRLNVIGLGVNSRKHGGAQAGCRTREETGKPHLFFGSYWRQVNWSGGGESIRRLRYRRPLEASQAASLPGTLCSRKDRGVRRA